MTLLVGPAGSGKTAAALAEYRKLAAVGLGPSRRRLWIAPTRQVAADIREALVDPATALLDPGVTTFADLAGEILLDAGVEARRINSLQRRRLLGRTIREFALDGKLPHFAAVAETLGVVAIIDEAIADAQQRAVTPAELKREAGRQDDAAALDIALVYGAYQEQLAAAGLIDEQTVLTAAAATLATSRELAVAPVLAVVDGFSDFTTIELHLLRQLLARTQQMLVTLPGTPDAVRLAPRAARERDGSRADFAANGSTTSGDAHLGSIRADLFFRSLSAEQLLRDMGAVVARRSPPTPAPWPALAHLERNLFRRFRDVEPPTPEAAASLARFHVVAASGLQAEIVDIARRVKGLLLGGAAPGDIVIAFRSTRDVAERVRQAFGDFGIPYVLDHSRALAATPLVRSLQGILRLAAEDWPYRRVLQVAGDRALSLFDGKAGEPDPPRAVETCVRYAQLPAGRGALLDQLESWAEERGRLYDPQPADAQLAATALKNLAELVDELPRRASMERWIRSLKALSEGLGLLHSGAAESVANWEILGNNLRAIALVDDCLGGEEEWSLSEFLEILSAVASQARAPRDRGMVGRVRVMSAESARYARPRHLFVGGLSEQSFPAPARGNGARPDASHSATSGQSAEMLLFYQLVTRPTESLTLSYAALDERAQSLPASPFLLEVERAFGDVPLPRTVQPLNYGRPSTDKDEPPRSRSELRREAVGRALERDRGLLATLAGAGVKATDSDGGRAARGMATKKESTGGTGGSYVELAVAGASILDGIEAIAARGRRDEFGPFEGVFPSDAAASALRDAFGAEHLWSPSRLETYARCPFLFFGEQLLRLRPTPELVLASDVRRRGSVLHETLARLYAELRDLPVDARAAAAIAQQFQAALTAIVESRPGRGVDAAIREIERRQIAAWADSFARQHEEYGAAWAHLDGPLEPMYFEARFGPGSKLSDSRGDAALSTDEPFALTASVDGIAEAVRFTGQIDRIDVGRVGERTVFNIVDYKSGARAAVKEAEIHAGKQIQLPIYALAVEQLLLADEQAAALTAGYWSVQGQGYRMAARSGAPLAINHVRDGALAPAPSWEGTRDKLISRIGEIISSIRRGQFPVFNDNENCTATCDLRTICRIAQVRSLEKQWPTGNGVLAPKKDSRQGAKAQNGEGLE